MFYSRYAISLAAHPLMRLLSKTAIETPSIEETVIIHCVLETAKGCRPWIVLCEYLDSRLAAAKRTCKLHEVEQLPRFVLSILYKSKV
jgi:hypothetical protein